ncbi:hypothetical protein PO124_10240 [Bacillus licheniformis]|nr:hypothetical protein [Bacillus licheniformis]
MPKLKSGNRLKPRQSAKAINELPAGKTNQICKKAEHREKQAAAAYNKKFLQQRPKSNGRTKRTKNKSAAQSAVGKLKASAEKRSCKTDQCH